MCFDMARTVKIGICCCLWFRFEGHESVEVAFGDVLMCDVAAVMIL
jgi:hypothetical protein